MKEFYAKPQSEVLTFNTADLITTSTEQVSEDVSNKYTEPNIDQGEGEDD